MFKQSKSLENLSHPLATDEGKLVIAPFIDLLKIDSAATVIDLILENTKHAKIIMEKYRSSSYSGPYNAMLFQSILALLVLHQSGASYKLLIVEGGKATELEEALVNVARQVYSEKIIKAMVQVYGLDAFEHNAIKAYSSPNKSDKELSGKSNPYYMGKSGMWGMYKDGWDALDSALKKLPSLGDLGLILTTYRATRTKKLGETIEAEALKKLELESHVQLGMKVMDMGQYHYTSTAITYNAHWERAIAVGGVIAITGYSGVYINPFGLQGVVDGGEILYRPGVLTTYESMNPTGYQTSKGIVPVFHLREVRQKETGQRVVEDCDFEVRQEKSPGLDKAKIDLIKGMEAIVRHCGSDVIVKAREATKIDGSMMYLTYDELLLLYQQLPQPTQYQTSASSSQAGTKDQLVDEIKYVNKK